MTTALLAALVGALLGLERKILGQLMLARPIVVAPAVAAVAGDAQTGLWIGLAFELFFLGSASYGAVTPDHETLAATFAAALAASAQPESAPAPVLAAAAYLALPLGPLGRRLEAFLEWLNVALVERAERLLAAGEPARASRQALGAVAGVAAAGAIAAFAGTLLGPHLGAGLRALPPQWWGGLALAWALFAGVCAAQGIRAIRMPKGEVLSGLAALTVFAFFGLARWLFH